jgi:hypothetical protein
MPEKSLKMRHFQDFALLEKPGAALPGLPESLQSIAPALLTNHQESVSPPNRLRNMDLR